MDWLRKILNGQKTGITSAVSSAEKNLDIEALSRLADSASYTEQKAALQALSRIASVPAGPKSGHARKELFARLTPYLKRHTESSNERIRLSLVEIIDLILPALKIMDNRNIWLQEQIVVHVERYRDRETDDVMFNDKKESRIEAGTRGSYSEVVPLLIKFWNYPGEEIEQSYAHFAVSLRNVTQAWKPHRITLQVDRLIVYHETKVGSFDKVGRIATIVRLDNNDFLLVKEPMHISF